MHSHSEQATSQNSADEIAHHASDRPLSPGKTTAPSRTHGGANEKRQLERDTTREASDQTTGGDCFKIDIVQLAPDPLRAPGVGLKEGILLDRVTCPHGCSNNGFSSGITAVPNLHAI